MTKKLFGTDGIRGRVGVSPITADNIVKLGWALGAVIKQNSVNKTDKVVIGKDTRVSGYMLESALEAGLSAAGVNVSLIGPMPTPGIAYLTRTSRASAGIVISASHNAFHDNGIKFFSTKGFKLPDDFEAEIEDKMKQEMITVDSFALGRAERFADAAGRYIEYCKSTFPQELSLDQLKIVIDCANGAAYHVAPHVFDELGAKLIMLGNKPDGLNINKECGSTHLAKLRSSVLEHDADLGIAFDGDGDRTILVDRNGRIIDGDQILYILAMERQRTQRLNGGVVGTVMTNMALDKAFEAANIPFVRSKVGDRHVLEQMHKHDWTLGGEGSGHIICLDKNTTGDGIVAALEVLSIMVSNQKSLDQLLTSLILYPQNMINVNIDGFSAQELMNDPRLLEAAKTAELALAGKGRLILRASGTEPLIRVMVEAADENMAHDVSNDVANVVKQMIS